MKRCGEGFKRVSKTNNPFISIELDLGVLGTVKAMMFQNTKKKEANDPDYNITIPDDKPQAGPGPSRASQYGKDKPYVKPKITPRPTPQAAQEGVHNPPDQHLDDWTHPVNSWDDGTPLGEEY